MTDRLVILGGLGDLTRRYLAPALAELEAATELDDGFEIVGVGRDEISDDDYRRRIGEAIAEHGRDVGEDSRSRLVERLRYVRGDATDPDVLRNAIGEDSHHVVCYLALPPGVFAPAIRGLAAVNFTGMLVVEKPFGHDLDSARDLNAVAHACLGEEKVFRIDHFLGMQTVQNILGLRFANRLLEPVWNCNHVARVEIIWDETLTLEGRGFYDEVGAVRDVVQNHLLQLLCLVAMEPPSSLGHRELRDRKVQLLREVRRLAPDEVRARTVRGRYTAGSIGGREVPDYTQEDGVDPERMTETFAEVELQINNWRWSNVPFVLRTGKALGRDRKEINVWFRPVPHGTFATAPDRPNVLRIGLDPETLALGLNVNTPGEELEVERVDLRRDLARGAIGAYARILLAAMQGDPTLSIRDDEIEESWSIVDPVLDAWDDGVVPMREYPAGSGGPTQALLAP